MKRERQQAASITFIKSETIKHAKERCKYTFFMDTELKERSIYWWSNNRGSFQLTPVLSSQAYYWEKCGRPFHNVYKNHFMSKARISISFENAKNGSVVRRLFFS